MQPQTHSLGAQDGKNIEESLKLEQPQNTHFSNGSALTCKDTQSDKQNTTAPRIYKSFEMTQPEHVKIHKVNQNPKPPNMQFLWMDQPQHVQVYKGPIEMPQPKNIHFLNGPAEHAKI